jgi:SAM-dependent methyltransferase
MAISAEQARRFYDRLGRAQDTQAFYENPAVDRLIALADFESASAVFELGCGTGRLARLLLGEHLPPTARYLATDVSARMTQLAGERLRPWAERATVVALEPPGRELPGGRAGFDRFLATYVFDLLSEDDARSLLSEAARLLRTDGRLCLASITHGPGGLARVVSNNWARLASRWPLLLGGCRPVDLRDYLPPRQWTIDCCEVVTSWGITSQVLVASAAE